MVLKDRKKVTVRDTNKYIYKGHVNRQLSRERQLATSCKTRFSRTKLTNVQARDLFGPKTSTGLKIRAMTKAGA